MVELDRRIGIFRIADSMIIRMPKLVMNITGQCIIIRAEHLKMFNSIEYTAMSEQFDILSLGREPQRYSIVTTSENPQHHYNWYFWKYAD